ncbi:MAG: chemotaxis-specific protein-glutamate methyltransferase CheB [Oligoflexales bacterium]|nr:chemotaxis-specific protein-glutamate methyltransferase CheB [Oligoflexales bacterium]
MSLAKKKSWSAYELPPIDKNHFDKISKVLKERTGITLGASKDSLISARLGKRLRALNLQNWSQYYELLLRKGEELEHFVNALTTNKTEFFREKEHFTFIENHLIKNPPRGPVSIWVVASSTGQEAYSLAMCMAELSEKLNGFDFRILASDIDTEALETGATGVYNAELVEQEVPSHLIKKYFLRGTGRNAGFYRISPDLAAKIKFRKHNICDFDLSIPMSFNYIFVRNILIYFDEQTIRKVISKLKKQLSNNGFIISGLCENLGVTKNRLTKASQSVYQAAPSLIRSTAINPISEPVADPNKKISVLIVDDSKVIQKTLVKAIEEDPKMKVFGVANDPLEAEKLMAHSEPDVITLDINMPNVSGIEYLETLIPKRKLPVIMVSAANNEDGLLSLKSLELGAIDFIQKPELKSFADFSTILRDKISSAHKIKKSMIQKMSVASSHINNVEIKGRKKTIIAIGTSTGGTVALAKVLSRLPKSFPPILIVQHIPSYFSQLLANRLNQSCLLEVAEAKHGAPIEWGHVYIAPGGKHLKIARNKDHQLVAHVTEGEPVNRHIPSADVLFESMAKVIGKDSVGIILTGMGKDGAKGLLSMKQAGSYNFAQDEHSSVVFGMPKEAIRLGAADEVISLDEVPEKLYKHLNRSS